MPNSNEQAVRVMTDLPVALSSFYVPRSGPLPANGVTVSWGTNHVEWMDGAGDVQRVHKIGWDFDPYAPLH